MAANRPHCPNKAKKTTKKNDDATKTKKNPKRSKGKPRLHYDMLLYRSFGLKFMFSTDFMSFRMFSSFVMPPTKTMSGFNHVFMVVV